MWSGVFFDLDGTLADTVELILKCFRFTTKKHFGQALPDSDVLATLGISLPVQMKGFARNDAEAELMRQTFIAYQDTVHDEMVRSFPGASTVLAALRKRGTKIAVVTSKRVGIARRTLECCGLWEAVDLVVCANQVRLSNPHPESVNLALSTLRLEPDNVVFVGDSPFDMQAGKGAGTRTAAALWGPFNPEELLAEEPDFVLEVLRDVLEISPAEAVAGGRLPPVTP